MFELIENIIDYSNEKLLIFFTNYFWELLWKECKESSEDNIINCYELRVILSNIMI
jgi:hypothetical protein